MKKIGNLRLSAMQKLTPEEQRQILGGADPTTSCPNWKNGREHWDDDIKDEKTCGCILGDFHTDWMWKMNDFLASESHFVGSNVEYTLYYKAHTVVTYTRECTCTGVKRKGYDRIRSHRNGPWEKWAYDRVEQVGKKATSIVEALKG